MLENIFVKICFRLFQDGKKSSYDHYAEGGRVKALVVGPLKKNLEEVGGVELKRQILGKSTKSKRKNTLKASIELLS